MKLSMQKGTISSYERSLIVHDSTKTLIKTEMILPGGNELKNLIDSYRLRMQVVSVFPAYRAVILNQVIDYVPVWAVELRDGTFDVLNP
jgi:exopolysaccharide biosynthesis predicted pyruvyltransferase EpsI